MNIVDERRGPLLVIRVNDARIDAGRTAAFKSYLEDRIRSGDSRLILDLTQVQFVDSSGLGALVFGLKSVGPGGLFALVGLTGSVVRLFSMTRMDRVFPLYASVDEAVAGASA
jgi:anti-sigma B factor antagonist